jgi:hypothetical protein
MKRFVAILIMGTLVSFIFSPTQATAQGTWKQFPVTPTIRSENSAALLDGKIYVLGGFTQKGATTRIDVWDPILNNWGMATPLPKALHLTTAVVVNGKIYVIGGFESGFWRPVNTTYEYDPAFHRWFNKTPMPTARGAHAAAIIKGKIHLVGVGLIENYSISSTPMPTKYMIRQQILGELYRHYPHPETTSPQPKLMASYSSLADASI